MKVKDIKTGNILNTDNEFVIEQFKKYPKRYKPVTGAASVTGKPDDKSGEGQGTGRQ